MIAITIGLLSVLVLFCAIVDPPGHERRDDDWP